MNLQTEHRTIVVNTFHRTEVVNSDMAIINILDTKEIVRFLKAYVVDKITTIAETEVPDSIKLGFPQKAQAIWRSRASGAINILIGKDAEAYHLISWVYTAPYY